MLIEQAVPPANKFSFKMKPDPENGTVDLDIATNPSNATTARGRFSFDRIGIFRTCRKRAREQDDQPTGMNSG